MVLQTASADGSGYAVEQMHCLVQDHVVNGDVLVTATMFMAMSAAICRRVQGCHDGMCVVLEKLAVELPLVLPSTTPEVAHTFMEVRFEGESDFNNRSV